MKSLNNRLAEAWLTEFMKVSGENLAVATELVIAAGMAVGPPDSDLRRAAMAYLVATDQRWYEEKEKCTVN